MVGQVTKCRVFGKKIVFVKDSAPLTTDRAAEQETKKAVTVADINRMNEEFWKRKTTVVKDEAENAVLRNALEHPQTMAEINEANAKFWGRRA